MSSMSEYRRREEQLQARIEELKLGLKEVDAGRSRWTYLWDEDGELLCSREYVERLKDERDRLQAQQQNLEQYAANMRDERDRLRQRVRELENHLGVFPE